MQSALCRLVTCLLLSGIIQSTEIEPPSKDLFRQFVLESQSPDSFVAIPSYELRQLGYHDAGQLSFTAGCGTFPALNTGPPYEDPETGITSWYGYFPKGSDHVYLYFCALWIGGIIGDDTLVSTSYSYTGYYGPVYEMWPADPTVGGIYRTGNYADDEFVATYTDTVTDISYVRHQNPYDDSLHTPLGLKIRQNSYSWSDTLYDNFVIFKFVIENIRQENIHDGWIMMMIRIAGR
jgi:hypothetical protein